MRGSPGPAGGTQVWPDKHVLVFRLWEEAGERFSHPGKPMIQRRGKDLDNGHWLPCGSQAGGPTTSIHSCASVARCLRCRQEPGSNIALPEDQGHATPPAMAQPSGKAVREPGSCPHREHSASKTAKQKTPPSARKAQKPHPTISRSPRIFYKKCPFQNTSHAEFSSLPRIETGSLSPQETGNVEGATGPPACRT